MFNAHFYKHLSDISMTILWIVVISVPILSVHPVSCLIVLLSQDTSIKISFIANGFVAVSVIKVKLLLSAESYILAYLSDVLSHSLLLWNINYINLHRFISIK